MTDAKGMGDAEIIETLATKVMGWVRKGGEWETPDNGYVYAGHCGDYYCQGHPHCEWNPLENPADSKMVREKLAERFCWSLANQRNVPGGSDFLFVMDGPNGEQFFGSGDTEERAVALCALKSIQEGE